jgi:hypothetical protein
MVAYNIANSRARARESVTLYPTIRGKKFTTHRYGWVTAKRYSRPNATVGPRNWTANKISQPFFAFTS